MGIFGGGEQPQREFGVRVNQSIYGLPLPVVMGTAQVQQSILWVDGFTSKQVSSKGGGKGGGGIPFFIQGTTSDPHFVPDVKGMVGGQLKGGLGGALGGLTGGKNPAGSSPADALGGLFGKKKKQ